MQIYVVAICVARHCLNVQNASLTPKPVTACTKYGLTGCADVRDPVAAQVFHMAMYKGCTKLPQSNLNKWMT